MHDIVNSKVQGVNETSYTVLEELEADRKRIARELHDSTIQMLTMLIYKAELCEKLVEKDTIRTKMELEIMIQVLRESIDDLRNTIYNLHPMLIDDLGLTASLERYLITLRRDSVVDFTLNVEGEEFRGAPVIALSSYRIVQECCNNIIKHSGASKASINIRYSDKEVSIHICDNGENIEHSQNEKNSLNRPSNENEKMNDRNHGLGIPMMKERVTLLGGSIDFQTDCTGTKVKAVIPFATRKEDYNE